MFTKERKQIKDVIKQTMKDMSDHIINRLADERIPVRTGHYVASHVVQTIDPSYPRKAEPMEPPYAPKMLASESYRAPVRSRLKAKADALIAKGEKTIHFGNKASYAHLVEYMGWTQLGGRTGPYQIFNSAEESARGREKSIATAAKAKVFK